MNRKLPNKKVPSPSPTSLNSHPNIYFSAMLVRFVSVEGSAAAVLSIVSVDDATPVATPFKNSLPVGTIIDGANPEVEDVVVVVVVVVVAAAFGESFSPLEEEFKVEAVMDLLP